MTTPPPTGSVAEVDGLQNERTSLAWVRTSLSLVAAGALLAKAASSSPASAAAILACTAAVGAALHVAADRTRQRRAGALSRGDGIVAPLPLLVTAAATTALALVAFAVIVLAL